MAIVCDIISDTHGQINLLGAGGPDAKMCRWTTIKQSLLSEPSSAEW